MNQAGKTIMRLRKERNMLLALAKQALSDWESLEISDDKLEENVVKFRAAIRMVEQGE